MIFDDCGKYIKNNYKILEQNLKHLKLRVQKLTLIFVSKNKIDSMGDGNLEYFEMNPLTDSESWTLMKCLDIQDR